MAARKKHSNKIAAPAEAKKSASKGKKKPQYIVVKGPKKLRGKQKTRRVFDGLSAEQAKTLGGIYRLSRGQLWSGLRAVPPGTLLDSVINTFERYTDIPLELPFATLMSLLSWILVKRGTVITWSGQTIHPALWQVVLAQSGAGKTYTRVRLSTALGISGTFPEASGAAKWLDDLAACEGKAYWERDEWAQILRHLMTPGHPLYEIRDYLLRAYDHEPLERRSKTSQVKVQHPILVILGTTVDATIRNSLNLEALLDGLSQRFLYTFARDDPARPIQDFALYPNDKIDAAISEAAQKFLSTPTHSAYTIGAEATATYKQMFKDVVGEFEDLDKSFRRRIAWRMAVYSLLYHWILGKSSSEIDAEDMRWAARVIQSHMQSCMEVIRRVQETDEMALLEKARVFVDRQVSNGITVKARDVQRGVRGISSVKEALSICRILGVKV